MSKITFNDGRNKAVRQQFYTKKKKKTHKMARMSFSQHKFFHQSIANVTFFVRNG